jgi:uncharacterized protein YyaL (SSP411 family)
VDENGTSHGERPRANRLSREKSPYLLQHRHNPVDWFPWGEEAFEKARAEDRPVFLSIGYSTCHWCHVMERESFEDERVAAFLNRHFVSIKVDREERPDVDRVYMTFVQATAGHGGWPLSCFLTPDREPFFGGTYFPPEDRHGQPGFIRLIQGIAALWGSKRSEMANMARAAQELIGQLAAQAGAGEATLTASVIERAGLMLKQSHDERNGGFGGAPKFPQPSQAGLLLRHAKRFNDAAAKEMVLHTCNRMAAGGIFDQLGGGFARYSVDAEWLVPHFEKMLYDNAQLAQLYLDAYLASGEPRYARVVRDTLGYVLRDMTHPEGGFYCAEDADSEGHEGKFYCWTRAELERLLDPAELEIVSRYFGVTERGNFTDHSRPHPLPGQNVLHVADPRLSEDEAPLLESSRAKMLAERSRRVRPGLDDKILASWNGLMLGALARAGVVLDDESYLAAADRGLRFVRLRLWEAETRTLYHRWRDGERDRVQLLDAYAFLLAGVLDLYQATLLPRHIELAVVLAEAMLARFQDPDAGGFWQSAESDLIVRVKEDYDGAEPSGNSVACLALLRLAAITDRRDFREAADRTLRLFAGRARDLPQAVPYLLGALDFWLQEPQRVVIAGDPTSAAARELLVAAHSAYQPNQVVLGNSGAVDPFARELPTADGEPTAYLCTGSACQEPTRDVRRLRELLRNGFIEL